MLQIEKSNRVINILKTHFRLFWSEGSGDCDAIFCHLGLVQRTEVAPPFSINGCGLISQSRGHKSKKNVDKWLKNVDKYIKSAFMYQ